MKIIINVVKSTMMYSNTALDPYMLRAYMFQVNGLFEILQEKVKTCINIIIHLRPL